MAAAKGKDGRPLHGAALAAHRRAAGHHGGQKPRKRNPGGALANPPNPPGRRKKRRNPPTTFVQALLKVAGGAAAMFGSGVLVTVGASKIKPGSPWTLYGFPVAAGVLGAAVATKYPVVGVGIAAGGAAPFVIPASTRMLQGPSANAASPATVSALRAVAMGGGWRALNEYPRPMAGVRMGTVYAT